MNDALTLDQAGGAHWRSAHDSPLDTSECSESFEEILALMDSSLGKAGFVTALSQRSVTLLTLSLVGAQVGLTILVGALHPTMLAAAIALMLGLSGSIGVLFLKHCRLCYQRRLLYSTPILLENLILLVESGLGLIPAIGKILEHPSDLAIYRPLRAVYVASHSGISISEAFRRVADCCGSRSVRSLCIQLELAATEGTELGTPLEALRASTVREWKLSVEERIKRLENLVIFPVFCSVIGMMLLLGAVPLVPVLELREQLRARPHTSSAQNISTLPQNIFATPGARVPNRE